MKTLSLNKSILTSEEIHFKNKYILREKSLGEEQSRTMIYKASYRKDVLRTHNEAPQANDIHSRGVEMIPPPHTPNSWCSWCSWSMIFSLRPCLFLTQLLVRTHTNSKRCNLLSSKRSPDRFRSTRGQEYLVTLQSKIFAQRSMR